MNLTKADDDMLYTIFYISAVVAVNVGFSHIPLIPVGAEMWPPLSLAVGAIFVLRDYAQRQIGHRIVWAMCIGIGVSYILADPYVATASALAFAASELADWLVYSVSKRPFHQRILISSAISTPIDSAIFLLAAGFFGPIGFITMTASKMLAALVVWKFAK